MKRPRYSTHNAFNSIMTVSSKGCGLWRLRNAPTQEEEASPRGCGTVGNAPTMHEGELRGATYPRLCGGKLNRFRRAGSDQEGLEAWYGGREVGSEPGGKGAAVDAVLSRESRKVAVSKQAGEGGGEQAPSKEVLGT